MKSIGYVELPAARVASACAAFLLDREVRIAGRLEKAIEQQMAKRRFFLGRPTREQTIQILKEEHEWDFIVGAGLLWKERVVALQDTSTLPNIDSVYVNAEMCSVLQVYLK